MFSENGRQFIIIAEFISLYSDNLTAFIFKLLLICLRVLVRLSCERGAADRSTGKNEARFSVTAEAVEKSNDDEQRRTTFTLSQGKMEIYGDERGTRSKHARVRLSLFRSCLRASPSTQGWNGRGR